MSELTRPILQHHFANLRFAVSWRPWGLLLLAAAAGLLLATLPLAMVGALLGATAVLLLILIQPLVGLVLALLLGPLGALEGVLLGSTLLDSGQVALLVTLVAWVGRGLVRRRVVVPATPLNLPFALLLLVQLMTLPGATAPEAGLIEMLKWVEMALIMWLVVDLGSELSSTVAPHRALVSVLAMLLLAGASQAIIGVWQFALRGDGPEHFLVLERFYRAYGTYEQPNPFGGFMNLTALLALGALVGLLTAWVQQRCEMRTNSVARWLLLILPVGLVALLTGMALIFSWSRGAWLGFAAGTGVLALFWPRKGWVGLLLLLLVALLVVAAMAFDLAPTAVTGRISSFAHDLRFGDVRGVDINDSNYAVLERLAHWQAALGMAQERLWLGVGFGNYEAAYTRHALLNWPAALGHAHNYYLNLLAETGVVGLVAYLLFWGAVFAQTLRVLRRLEWPLRGVALGLLAAWTSLTVHHLVDKLYVNNIYVHLGVMLGLLQLLSRCGRNGCGASGRHNLFLSVPGLRRMV